MKTLFKMRYAFAGIAVVAALVLAVVFPIVALPAEEGAVTLFDLPLVGTVAVSSTLQIILNVVASFIFLLYLVFEILRGRLQFGRTMRFAGICALAAILAFGAGTLVAYISAAGAGIEYHFLQPIEGNGASGLIMTVSFLLIALVVAFCYFKGRSDVLRKAQESMRSSASYTAAGKYALTTAYGVLLLCLIIGEILLGIVGFNQLFFVPLACGAVALALWRATGWKFFIPLAVFLIVLNGIAVMAAVASQMTIGVFGVLAANGTLDLLLVISLCDLYTLHKK